MLHQPHPFLLIVMIVSITTNRKFFLLHSEMEFKPIKEVDLPTFTMAHVLKYFLLRVVCDGKSANDYKNLDFKAFPLFRDGHVQDITAGKAGQVILYRAKCLPEMKKTVTYGVELSQDVVSGDISSALCGCPAGRGPNGSCKHIAALCYALEEFNRIKATVEYTACTSKLQEWNKPRKRILEPQHIDNIKFVKHEYGKVKREHSAAVYDPRPQHLQHTAESEVEQFCSTLQSFNRPCGFLHVIHAPSPVSTPLPLIPRSVRERVLVCMRSMEHPLSLRQIFALEEMFVDRITPDQQQARSIEMATRRQFASKRWYEERYCRLTSSKFGEICKSKCLLNTCTKALKNPTSVLSSAALLWGRDHESQAREEYAQTLEEGWSVEETGIHISTAKGEGYLGASPDGLVCYAGEVRGCIEVKCPFSARDQMVSEACSMQQFFCMKDENNKVTLKVRHNYYYQVQGQLAILNLDWCDFIVWTNKDLHVERVKVDHGFWQQQCLPKLRSYYYNIMLPEIIYPRHPLDIITYNIV